MASPYHMPHMLKCKANDISLPNGILITQIMQYIGVNLFFFDKNTIIGLRQHFSINSLKKFNIIKVNDVWQDDHYINDDEGQQKEQSTWHDEPVIGNTHGHFQHPPIHLNSEMLSQT